MKEILMVLALSVMFLLYKMYKLEKAYTQLNNFLFELAKQIPNIIKIKVDR